MDATFLSLINGISWHDLTAGEAVQLRKALRDAVAKSDEWFSQLASGFALETRVISSDDLPPKLEAGGIVRVSAPIVRKTPEPPAPKRKRGRPPKAKVISAKPPPQRPKADHPTVVVSPTMYVSQDGPRDGGAPLPPGHPRESGPVYPGADPDFEAASRGKIEFN